MTHTEYLADLAVRNVEMLKWHLADFSDADMFVRPVPGANHAAWQVAHLINAEGYFMNFIKPGTVLPIPAAFKGKFGKDDSKIDDPKHFPTKAELIEVLSTVRRASAEVIRGLTPADLAKEGPEPMRSFAPTVGHLCSMLVDHTTMHVGQLQVIRRKLGKPVLF